MDDAIEEGAHVGRYVVLERIGGGGMGVVYGALDPELGRRVAIKLLHGGATSQQDSVGRGRMLREAQALARLSHENVVTIHDVGLHETRVFIAMEFVEGQTLGEWLRAGRPDARRILEVFFAAGRGLSAAHAAGLVHRDFKPDNVLVGDDGRVRVTDFGLARISTEESRPREEEELPTLESRLSGEVALQGTLTKTGALLGTPAYMAPEQFAGVPLDGRADQFSFCVALFEALCGERPFSGATVAELAFAVQSGQMRAASNVSPQIRRALRRGLAPTPEDRFATLDALMAALGRDPWYRWRRVALAGAPPMALLGLWAMVPGEEPGGLCVSVERRLEGVWDAARQREIEGRFRASEMPYADDAWEAVREGLGVLSTEWVSAQREVCESEPGQQDAAVIGRRVTCLHRRFEELRSVSDLLAQADERIIEKAVETVEALESVEACERAHLGRGEVPDAEAEREIVAGLARAKVLAEAGRYRDAKGAIVEAKALAEKVDDRWLAAEATYELALVLESLGEMPEADRAYHDAFSASISAGHDEVTLHAAIGVGALETDREKDFDEADRWVDHAEGAMERLGERGAWLESSVDTMRGRIANGRGDFHAARQFFERSLATKIEGYGDESTRLAPAHTNLGHVLANLGEFEQAVHHMRRGLELEEEAYGPQHPKVATSAAALCTVLREKGEVDDALPHCQRSVDVLRATVGEDHPRTGTALIGLGSALQEAGRAEEGGEMFRAALVNTRKVYGERHPRVGLVLNNLSVHHEMEDQLAEAERYARQALGVFEESLGPEHPNTAVVATNLANLLTKQERYQDAEVILRRQVNVLEDRLGARHPDLAVALAMLAESFIHRERLEDAVPLLERALDILENVDGRKSHVASTQWALGATLVELGAQRERGLSLVRAAREQFASGGGRIRQRVDEVNDWLAVWDPPDGSPPPDDAARLAGNPL